MPRLCEVYPGICLTAEERARKNLSQGSRRMPVGKITNRARAVYHITGSDFRACNWTAGTYWHHVSSDGLKLLLSVSGSGQWGSSSWDGLHAIAALPWAIPLPHPRTGQVTCCATGEYRIYWWIDRLTDRQATLFLSLFATANTLSRSNNNADETNLRTRCNGYNN